MQCPLALFCFLTLVMIIPTLTNYKYLNNQSFRLVCYEVQITLGARGSSALVGIMHGATRGCKAAIFTASRPRMPPLSLYERGRTSSTQGKYKC